MAMTMPRVLLPPAVALLAIVQVLVGCSVTAEPPDGATQPGTATSPPETPDSGGEESEMPVDRSSEVGFYGYEVVNAYPHDEGAFTQGLAFDNGYLYEGTGLQGRSSLRRVALETGEVLESTSLRGDLFGEGITMCGDRIVQLTWKAGVGLVYDEKDLGLLREFTYDTEGWGVTYDGSRLIMSDGTSTLYFLDPETFVMDGRVEVHDRGAAVGGLNELEFIDGQVYANVWQTERIVIIDPANGRVTGWLDLSGLLASRPTTGRVDVLNGIAWDAANDRLFVTGKLWPWLFEIRLLPEAEAIVP